MAGVRTSRLVPECTTSCRSIEHAERAVAAITLSGTDEQVADYLESLCANFCNLVDADGRSVLHMAASCNRWKLIRWVLTAKKQQLNAKAIALRDPESGWTPLHRAVFYGQLSAAKVLVEHGSNLSILDRECLSPLQLAMKHGPDQLLRDDTATAGVTGLYEAYVWGINDNYNLGLGTHQSRVSPELVEFFRKERVDIKQVVMCKFHTVFLSYDGKVYTCGHGQGGRLGHVTERAVIVPQALKFANAPNFPAIRTIAASTNHSAFLAENGTVWTCGLNAHHQLGHCPAPAQLLTPTMLSKHLFKGHSIVGVYTGLYHTVVQAEDALYTFGLNAGQLGHLENSDVLQTAPKMVSALHNSCFTLVAVSDGATVCATQVGDVYTLYEYKCRKVASKQRNIVQIAVSGGRLDSKRYSAVLKTGGTFSELRIVLLRACGRIFMWSESCPTVTRCLISLERLIHVSHLALFGDDNAVFTTDEGEGFVGHFHKLKTESKSLGVVPHNRTDQRPSSGLKDSDMCWYPWRYTNFVDHDECFHVQVKRLSNVFRGVQVTCDYKGQNFCVIQANPKVGLVKTPSVSPSRILTEMSQFLSDADTNDTVHDIVIEVDQHMFAAHRYLLASRSEYFRRKILERKFQDESLVLDCSGSVRPATFEQLLKFIYTDHCDLLKDGQTASTSCSSSSYADLTRRNQPDLVVSTLVDPHKISAFQVAQERKKSESDAARSPRSAKNKHRELDPVSQLREAAQRFGVPDLLRRLNCVAYLDDRVVVLEPLPTRQLKFHRHKFSELYDVCIVARNGREIRAHKCVLMARSEYFNSMLASGWLETSSSVNLPISADIIELVVAFLYGDDSEHFRRSDDAEFVCNVLVVADLLLLARLKQLCEVVLCDLLTLKNVVDMIEFSVLYNADQLKLLCMNFVGLNLAALLESKAICALSDEVMEDLTKNYRQMIPEMSLRVIEPCSNLMDKIKFEDQTILAPLEATPTDDLASFVVAKEVAMNGGRTTKKSQSGRRSTSSVSSITTSPKGSSDRRQRTVSTCSVESGVDKKGVNTSPKAKGRTVESPKKGQGSVSASSSPSAQPSPMEIVHDSPHVTPSKWLGGAEDMDHAFPDILNELSRPTCSSSPQQQPLAKVHRVKSADKVETPHAAKLSQKQRKKLAREAVQSSSPIPIPHSLMMEKYGKSATWGHDDQSSGMISLKGLENLNRKALATSPLNVGVRTKVSNESTSSELSLSSSSSSSNSSNIVVNVWQMKKNEKADESTPCFADILKMEEERKMRLRRMQTKQLHFIQLEDRAMNELLTFYKSRCDHDENIVVERILPDCAVTPVWRHTK